MNQIFELYDEITDERISLHRTLLGALLSLAAHMYKLAKPLSIDYDDAKTVDFTLNYRVRTLEIQE